MGRGNCACSAGIMTGRAYAALLQCSHKSCFLILAKLVLYMLEALAQRMPALQCRKMEADGVRIVQQAGMTVLQPLQLLKPQLFIISDQRLRAHMQDGVAVACTQTLHKGLWLPAWRSAAVNKWTLLSDAGQWNLFWDFYLTLGRFASHRS